MSYLKSKVSSYVLKFFMVFLLLIYSISLFAQKEYSSTSFGSKNDFNSVAFEADTVWAATSGGLMKLKSDGTFLKAYNSKNGLPDDYAFDVKVDSKGYKWVTTYDGVVRFGNGVFTTYTTNDGLASNNSRNIAFQGDTVFVCSYDNGLSRFDGTSWTVIKKSDNGLPSNEIKEITVDKNKNLWLNCSLSNGKNSLVKYDGNSWVTYNSDNTGGVLSGNYLYGLYCDEQGNLWVGESSSFYKFDGTVWSKLSSNDFSDVVTSFSLHNGVLWFSIYGKGIGKMDTNTNDITVYSSLNSQIHNRYTKFIKCDSNGNKWVGYSHKFEGLSKTINGISDWTIHFVPSLASKDIRTVSEDHQGRIWIGTSNGISIYDNDQWVNYNTGNGLVDNSVNCLYLHKDSSMWVGTDNGISVFKKNVWTTHNSTSTQNVLYKAVKDIKADANGNLFISTNYGIVKYDNSSFTKFAGTAEIGLNIVNDIEFDSAGVMWVATGDFYNDDNGLSKFENNQWTNYTVNTGLNKGITHDIEIDKNGHLWLATDSYVTKYDGTSFTKIKGELSSSTINSIRSDSNGMLWFSTNSALYRFDLVDKWDHYSTYYTEINISGLIIRETFMDSKGRIWISTDVGISLFDKPKNNIPTDIKFLNYSFSLTEKDTVGHVVDRFSTVDEDDKDTHTYKLINGDGKNDIDNSKFSIDSLNLILAKRINYNDADSLRIYVQTTDSRGGQYSEAMILKVDNQYFDPHDILLDTTVIPENLKKGSVVAKLSAKDYDTDETHTFTLIKGDGTNDIDNDSFEIEGANLKSSIEFDYDTKKVYNIFIKVKDNSSREFSKAFVLSVIDVNALPTDIKLSNDTILETVATGALVGNLSSVDADSNNSHTYSLVEGDGGDDNQSFSITGDKLSTKTTFDYKTKKVFKVLIRTDDGKQGIFDKAFSIHIREINFAPTDINISNSEVNENLQVGVVVGEFSTVDPNDQDVDKHSYSLVTGDGTNDSGNSSFTIENNQLKANVVFDYEKKSTYSILVKSTDPNGAEYQKALTITIIDQLETDIDDFEDEIKIYPNPVVDVLYLDGVSIVDAKLFDTRGRLVTSGTDQIDVQDISPGLYILKVQLQGRIFKTYKIIKK